MDEVDTSALRALLSDLERLHERCMERFVTADEARAVLAIADQRMRAALPNASDLFRIVDRTKTEHTDWWRSGVSDYVDTSDCDNVRWRLTLVQQLLQREAPDGTDPAAGRITEYYFPAGSVFRARQVIHRILSGASRGVLIVDNYLDSLSLDLADALDDRIEIKLLTGKPKAFFVNQLRPLRQTKANVEGRSNTMSHDRWLLLDGEEVWHLGASLNGLGVTASRLSRVVDPIRRAQILADLDTWWANGSAL